MHLVEGATGPLTGLSPGWQAKSNFKQELDQLRQFTRFNNGIEAADDSSTNIGMVGKVRWNGGVGTGKGRAGSGLGRDPARFRAILLRPS